MYYALKIYINSNNQGILNAVKNVIPAIDDPIVNSEYYDTQEGFVDLLNCAFFMADIQFNNTVDRDNVLQSIKGLNGVINACLIGSRVVGYTHNHNDGLPCEQETILEKT